MNNVEVSFIILDNKSKSSLGFKKITCDIIFGIKFERTSKSIYVGVGHLTQVPVSMSYSRILSRASVRIFFLIAAINDLYINMCDIGDYYLNVDTMERLWFTAGY